MNSGPDKNTFRPREAKGRGRALARQTFELQTLELLVEHGEKLENLLEESAQRLTAMELADAGTEN